MKMTRKVRATNKSKTLSPYIEDQKIKRFILSQSFFKGMVLPDDNFKIYPQVNEVNNHSLLPHLFCFKYFQENIGYILHEPETNSILMFDWGDFSTGQKALQMVREQYQIDASPTHLFCTHYHQDVSGDKHIWKQHYPNIEIVAGSTKLEEEDHITIRLNDEESMPVGKCFCIEDLIIGGFNIEWMDTSGHTHDHVSFLISDTREGADEDPIVFSGNAVFNAGWGAIFQEINSEYLYLSFEQILNLPDNSRLFPSADLTLKNLVFASVIFPDVQPIADALKKALDNQWVQRLIIFRIDKIPLVGSTIGEERATNPFSLIQDNTDPIDSYEEVIESNLALFFKLRESKDTFMV